MMRVNTLIAILLLLGGGAALAQDAPYRAGVHYFEIEQAPTQRDNVEVTEAFSYLCNHCATFEPYMQNWKGRMPENVVLKRISVGFGRRAWELYSRAYVTASLMGIEEASHVAMMDAIWKEGRQMRSLDELAEFYTQFGVGKESFVATAQSFNVDTQMRREQRMIQTYGVTGTPSMIVNGRYRVSSNQQVPGFDAMLSVVDFLVARELTALEARQLAELAASSDESAD
jgi:thiol:disulfide interchange protein DsbA